MQMIIQEDFHTLTYGFKMTGEETEASVMSPVKELEEELGRIVKVCEHLVGVIYLFPACVLHLNCCY